MLPSRCGFEPGEFIVVWVESQAIHSTNQRYKVIDVAVGVIERGTRRAADAVKEQPWLPNGPIPLQAEWSRAGTAGVGAPDEVSRQDDRRERPRTSA